MRICLPDCRLFIHPGSLLIQWMDIMQISNNSGTCWFPILKTCWFGGNRDQSARMMWLMAVVAKVIPYYRWRPQNWRQGLVVQQTYMNDSHFYSCQWGTCRQHHGINPTVYVGKNRQTLSSLPLPRWLLCLVTSNQVRVMINCESPGSNNNDSKCS